MAKRHDDALFINWGGGCNPSGLARAPVNAIDEARAKANTSAVGNDPAVRLILHQLCHLSGILLEADAKQSGFNWNAEIDACSAYATDCTLERFELHRPLPGHPGSSTWSAEQRTQHKSKAAAAE